MKIVAAVLLSLSVNPITYASSLSERESQEVNARLERFYQSNGAAAMLAPVPRFSAESGNEVATPAERRVKRDDPAYRRNYCEKILKKRFKGIACEDEMTWAPVQANDRVEDLAETWMPNVSHDLDSIPSEGKSNLPLWSDDYWRTKWGYTSYRYGEYDSSHESKKYKEMIALYSQPMDFKKILSLPEKEAETRLIRYSPAEKYDLVVGDEAFTLTNEQKEEGKQNIGSDGDVESWMGLCHGWAPAALRVDRPLKPVTLKGLEKKSVTFYPADIKALLTLQWSNGNYQNNFVGGRCGSKSPELYPNGRIKNQECFDNNPATWHLALGNMIGREKVSFVMDKTWDYEVWNQPVVGYEFTYFNPLNRAQRSKNWKDVAVDYDDNFKKQDRFQKPLTRGKNIEKIVGVITTVSYVSEVSPPAHSPEPEADSILRMTLTYDLEITKNRNRFEAVGGEWHENAHPDFLWVPQRESFASNRLDKSLPQYHGEPTAETASVAKKASAQAYPLCQVLRELVKKSTGRDSVQCNGR